MAEYSEYAYDELGESYDGSAVSLGDDTNYRCQYLNEDGFQCLGWARVAYPVHSDPDHIGGEQWALVNLCLEHYQIFQTVSVIE